MKTKIILPAFATLISSSLVAIITSSIAWFSNKISVTTEDNLTGSSDGAYFAYGTGTIKDDPQTLIKEGPYGIETPRQLYNLAWLQYLGYFNRDTDGDGVIEQIYFELNANIDMTGWILPPIGTTLYPFIGNFNGRNFTIKNLKISNNYQEILATNKMPSKVRGYTTKQLRDVNIVGMFGVIGELNKNITATYDKDIISVRDFTIAGAEIKNSMAETLAGIAAGYVNGPLKNVAITSRAGDVEHGEPATIASRITTTGATNYDDYTKFTNISNYGVVGYCEPSFLDQVKNSVTETYNATSRTYDYIAQTDGEDRGWGGSIDMKTTYDGLLDAWHDFDYRDTYSTDFPATTTDGTGIYTYPATQRITRTDGVVDETVNTEETIYYRDTFENNSFRGRYIFYTTNRKNGSNQKTSQFTFAHRSYTERYMYLYGSYDFQVNNGTSATYIDYNTVQASMIKIKVTTSGNTYFMTYNNGSLGYTSDEDSATVWAYKDNYIYYIINDGDNSEYYYLFNNNGTLELSTSTSNRTAFSYDSTNDNYYVYTGGNNQYITYSNSKWIIGYDHTVTDTFMLIESYQHDGNYLTVTSGTTLGNTTDEDKGAIWKRDNSNRYYTTIGGTPYYLVYNSGNIGLNANTTNTYTINSSNYLLYTYSEWDWESWSRVTHYCYLYYDGANWTTSNSTSNTRNDNNRLDLTGTRVKVVETCDYDYANSINSGSSYKSKTTTGPTNINGVLHTQSTYFPLKQGTYNTSNYFRIYCMNGNNRVYLYKNGNNVSTDTNVNLADVFVYDGNGYFPKESNGLTGNYLKLYRYNNNNYVRFYNDYSYSSSPNFQFDGTYFSARYGVNTYYLVYNNGNISLTTGNNRTQWYIENLNVKVPNGIPEDTNTGYIIGGANDTNKVQGNMRISRYYGPGAGDNSDIKGVSIGADDEGNPTATINNIYTINGDNQVVPATENLFGEDTPFPKTVSSMESVFAEDPESIFGLHFMDSEMIYGNGRSVIAETATINKNTYSNYEFPQNCIDFNLKEKGYINFVAGTYFPGNNCFFTISQIERNDNNEIDEMKNIRAVYSSTNQSYSNVYYFDDDTYSVPYKFKIVDNVAVKVQLDESTYTEYSTSPNLPDAKYGYSLKFNSDWIDTNQTSITGDYFGYPFYFEIPMNDGEYAMGAPHFASGTQANGAYLMYLDIGANAKKVYRSEIIEYFKWIDKVYSYPRGVFVCAAGTTNASDQNSYCICLKDSYTGTLIMDRTGNAENDEAKYSGSGDSTKESIAYMYPHLLLKDEAANVKTIDDVTPDSTTTTEIKRLTYYDYNMNDSTLNKIVITDVIINGDVEHKTRTVEKYSNFNIETQTGKADDELVIYIKNGDITTKITDPNTISFSTSGNTTKILSFTTTYVNGASITITFRLDVTGTPNSGHTEYTPKGYTYTVTLTRPDGTTEKITAYCYVKYYVNSDGTYTYTFKINDNSITGVSTTPIEITVPAIPQNNPQNLNIYL